MASSHRSSELVQSVVESYLLQGERKYDRHQVAELSGVAPTVSRRLWTALGFPANDDDAVDYTDGDIEAVREFRSMSVVGGADLRSQAAAARTIGRQMARLAEWQADLVLAEIYSRINTEGDSPENVRRIAEETM